MTPFEIARSEHHEILLRRLAESQFCSLFRPLAAYCERVRGLMPLENWCTVAETGEALRKALEPFDEATTLLILLHALVVEADTYYKLHLSPLTEMLMSLRGAA